MTAVREIVARSLWCSSPSSYSIWASSSPSLSTFAVSHRRALRRGFATSRVFCEKKYTKQHEWIELSADKKTATIGISKFAANSLGDVVYVELPIADQEVKGGDAIGAVESVKSASDIYAPISGTIVEGNSELETKPGLINEGPEQEGWIAKLTVEDPSELEKLLDAEAYEKHTSE